MNLPDLNQVDDDRALEVGKLLIKNILEQSHTEGVFDLTVDYSTNALAVGQFLSEARDSKGKRLLCNYKITASGSNYFSEYSLASAEQAKNIVDLNESDTEFMAQDEVDDLFDRRSKDPEFNEKFENKLEQVKDQGITGFSAYLYAEYLIDLTDSLTKNLNKILN